MGLNRPHLPGVLLHSIPTNAGSHKTPHWKPERTKLHHDLHHGMIAWYICVIVYALPQTHVHRKPLQHLDSPRTAALTSRNVLSCQ